MPSIKHERNLRGAFTVVELLMALAISALLLAGAAVAINVSSQTITVNDRIEQFSHSARMVLGRMAREIRNAEEVEVTGGTVLQITFPSGASTAWTQYQLTNGQIIYSQNDGSNTVNHVLLSASDGISVSTMSFTPQDINTTSEDAEAINVRLVLSGGGETVSLSSSSWPRRHLNW